MLATVAVWYRYRYRYLQLDNGVTHNKTSMTPLTLLQALLITLWPPESTRHASPADSGMPQLVMY